MLYHVIASSLWDYLPGIITAVFSGGVGASIVAWYKVPAERGQIIVTAAQGALIVQTGVITTLKAEIERLTLENEELRQKVESLSGEIASIKYNQLKHDGEVRDLQGRKKL